MLSFENSFCVISLERDDYKLSVGGLNNKFLYAV